MRMADVKVITPKARGRDYDYYEKTRYYVWVGFETRRVHVLATRNKWQCPDAEKYCNTFPSTAEAIKEYESIHADKLIHSI